MAKWKPLISVDFDGVLHSYTSGWDKIHIVSDAPVPGMLEWLVGATNHFDVAIFSARSKSVRGRWAMKRWLRKALIDLAPSWQVTPRWWKDKISETAFADPWKEEVEYTARCVVKDIKWPWFKPAALLTLDDRAICFDGTPPSFDEIRAFKPWNKK